MLRKRLIASFFMITPVLIVMWLDTRVHFGHPGIWSIPIITLASVVIASELMAMTRERTVGATPWAAYLGCVLCNLAVVTPELVGVTDRWLAVSFALCLAIGAAFGNELVRFDGERPATKRIALTMLVVLYSGWLLCFLTSTRIELGNESGMLALFSILFIIKMSDAGAYFVGKNLGKNKLAPLLSPGKTIEGPFGGIAAAVLAAWLVFAIIQPQVLPVSNVNWPAVFGYAVSICLCGVVGDLSESLIERDMGCKDSSGWLPGLGGIMDTADSVLFAAPVAYLWWSTGLL